MKDAHAYPDVFEDLGVNLSELGCLMLKTDNPLKEAIPDTEAYVSSDPNKWWVDGVLDHWHVTVRYGFLPEVSRVHVQKVIKGLSIPSSLHAGTFEVFGQPDDPYECVVLRIADERLAAMNAQLSVLPHINTYVEYRPHITVGFFNRGWFRSNKGLLYRSVKDTVKTLEFDYGQVL